jgi:ABC-type antimicrobial peptide transport system permease subunit
VVIRCLPGHQKEAKEAIARYHDPDHTEGDFYGEMSLYDYMDQNNSIWNSIGFIAWTVAIIAFIITLLGVYSAISIDTTRRRKEMAVRKINGAKTRQITMQFANLYVKLFLISSVVSIPLSAFIIKQAILNGRPLEKGTGYVILFYLFILAVIVAFVSLTIGFKIHHIARENPADVVKSE